MATDNSQVKSAPTNYVIDASISSIENLSDFLNKLCQNGDKLILTSITIKELDKMQSFQDTDAKGARYILAFAAENPDYFDAVLIDENLDTPDDCIINYCKSNIENVVLLTSDKVMTLKARMYSIKVQYIKKTTLYQETFPRRNFSHTRTLIPAKRLENSLIIPEFQTTTMSIVVYSNGIEYTKGPYELKIGDEVYLSTKKKDYISFAHYQITSLYATNNCKIICSKRIYDNEDLNNIENATYKSIIKQFRYNLNIA